MEFTDALAWVEQDMWSAQVIAIMRLKSGMDSPTDWIRGGLIWLIWTRCVTVGTGRWKPPQTGYRKRQRDTWIRYEVCFDFPVAMLVMMRSRMLMSDGDGQL